MNAARTALLAVVFALVACQAPAEYTPPPDPKVDPAALLRPTFDTREGVSSAGHAFLIHHNGATVLVSAHHILGPAGGLKHPIAWDHVPAAVNKVTATSGDKTVTSTRALAIEGARALEPRDPSADLSAFLVDDAAGVPALELADTMPKTGDYVWLFAEVIGVANRGRTLHRGSVSAVTDKELRYIFADTELKLQATSGAAVLDAKGKVVAVNLGGGANVGVVFGVGNPATSVRARLDKAIPAPAPR